MALEMRHEQALKLTTIADIIADTEDDLNEVAGTVEHYKTRKKSLIRDITYLFEKFDMHEQTHENYDSWLYNIQTGLDIAFTYHEGQGRKSQAEYIEHSIQTGYVILRAGGSSTLVAAALLHDVLEENPKKYEEIQQEIHNRFQGLSRDYILKLVNILTPDMTIEDRTARKSHMLDRMRQQPEGVRFDLYLTKGGDRLVNIRTRKHLSLSRQREMLEETRLRYIQMAKEADESKRFRGDLKILPYLQHHLNASKPSDN